jgi:hypothetical protein
MARDTPRHKLRRARRVIFTPRQWKRCSWPLLLTNEWGDRRTRARLVSASHHNNIAGPWWKTAPTRFRSPMPTSYQTEDSTKPWCLWSRSAGSVRLWGVVLMRGSLAADRGPKKLGWGSSAESRGRSTAWFARVSAALEAEPDSGYLSASIHGSDRRLTHFAAVVRRAGGRAHITL